MMNRLVNVVIPLFVGTIIECSSAFTPQSILAKATFFPASHESFPQEHFVEAQTTVNNDVMGSSWDVLSSPSFSLLAEDGDGILDIVKNIAIAITAILFLLAGLAQVTAAVIVPAAAKELEKECKELAPDLWEEYQLKLESGQTMEQRPDLMQELGQKLQPMLDSKMERVFADAKEEGIDMSEDEKSWNAIGDMKRRVSNVPDPAPAPSPTGTTLELSNTDWDEDEPTVIDAEVIIKEDTDEKK